MAIHFNRILPNLYVGTVPKTFDDVERLIREAGISAVINLQTDDDFEWYQVDWPKIQQYYEKRNIEFVRKPVQDFQLEDLRDKLPDCAKVVDDFAHNGHIIYLHCTAGINRSPTVAIGYLYSYLGYDMETAIRTVKGSRVCDPYLEALYLAKF
ncbi:MAG: dual specificity protein phosphatase family protein [Acidobacteria bacterium]|nr:dual specificity protein phosphatase family protein [Acidobacteriota bacterium]